MKFVPAKHQYAMIMDDWAASKLFFVKDKIKISPIERRIRMKEDARKTMANEPDTFRMPIIPGKNATLMDLKVS